jgi:hypothetical protein
MTRLLRVAIAAAVATTTCVVVALTTDGNSHHVRPVAHPAVHLAADDTLASYPEVGVTTTPPTLPLPAPAPAAASVDAVLTSLRTAKAAESGRGLAGDAVNSSAVTATQRSVVETMPEPGDGVVAGVPYDAWVVVVPNVAPVSFSGGPVPAGVTSCTVVAIMNIASGQWTDFFSEC